MNRIRQRLIRLARGDAALDEDITGSFAMHEMPFRGCRCRIHYACRGRPIDGKHRKIECGDRVRLTRDERHRFAPEPRVAVGERRLIGERRDNAKTIPAGNVPGGKHGLDPGMRAAPGVDIPELECRAVVWRADRPDQQRAVRPEVGAENFRTGDFRFAVQPLQAGADGISRFRFRRRWRFRRRFAYGGDDFLISRTPAQYARKRFLDLRSAGRLIFRQKRRRRHQHARRADPALRGAVAQEGLLQRREGFRRQALDRLHFPAGRPYRRRQAGANGRAVDQYRAGATIPGIAADLRAPQSQLLAQHLAEPAAGRRCQRNRPAVHDDGHRFAVHDRPASVSARMARRTSSTDATFL